MSGDIVERLRLLAKTYPQWGEVKTRCNEGADEIERLRADLDAERALSDKLHHALCVSALHLSDREVANALAAYRDAQRERNRGQAVS